VISIDGPFEIHVTVALVEESAAALRKFCSAHGWKCVHILLSRGQTPSQPMLTCTKTGTIDQVLQIAEHTACTLSEAGFRPVRIKLEASPFASGVPQADDDPQMPDRYFEHHVKLVLPSGESGTLVPIVERHRAHLSRNAFKQREDGHEERFVTLRNFGVGRVSAMARLDELLNALRTAHFNWVSVESEYSVYDTCLELDVGWLDMNQGKQHG
jgi:hypothetical protein